MITETRIDVRYPDCDRMGIVHHAVYPIWYEMARMDFFAHMGFSYADMNAQGINPPLVELDLKYKAPATYPGTVTVKTRMTMYAPKKLELQGVPIERNAEDFYEFTSSHLMGAWGYLIFFMILFLVLGRVALQSVKHEKS